jgi:glycosyltransferase involved in cell wall biosynthesis
MRNFAPADVPADAIPVRESRDVFFAGRLTVEKGAVILARAFARIARKHPSSRLVLAGEGPGRASIAAAGIPEDQLIMPGLVPPDSVRSMMSRARLVAAPSTSSEGSPLVVIEAALLGRPLVTSDYPGLRELVDEAGCGIVVPAGDEGALSSALDELLSDPDRASALGEAGRRTALATRTPEVAVATLRAVYAEAVERKRRPG